MLTGEISYNVKSITPIIINGSKDDSNETSFFMNENGRLAIPGSTMRGLIKSNVQILSLSDFGSDIDDYSLMYRHVAAGALKKKYGDTLGNKTVKYNVNGKDVSISILANVKAGYIKNTGDKMVIYPAPYPKDMEKAGMPNYYVLSERTIVDNYIISKQENKEFAYPLFMDNEGPILQHMIDRPFEKRVTPDLKPNKESFPENDCKIIFYKTITKNTKRGDKTYYVLSDAKKDDSYKQGYSCVRDIKGCKMVIFDEKKNWLTTGAIHYIGEVNKQYVPYMRECSYEVNGKNVTKVKEPGKCSHNGWVVSTGKMQEKKSLYIIPAMESSANSEMTIKIPEKDIKAYIVDYNNKKNTLCNQFRIDKKISKEEAQKKAQEFYGLPNVDEIRPVFYINETNDDRIYFGFTPHLRLFYKNSVKKGYRSNDGGGYDLATSLFGMSNSSESYKSKTSFIDAEIQGKLGEKIDNKVILASPKPSSYLDYIVQSERSGEVKSYESEGFELRGVKQYWLQDSIINDLNAQNNEGNNVTKINALPENTEFSGVIRFQNLTKKELGLLLWALRLEENSNMNIGMGKPYGYGRIKISDIKLKVVDNNKAYSLEGLELNPFIDKDISEYINLYKGTEINGVKITDISSIKQFFKMKDAENLPKSENIRYMSIDSREYQNRNSNLVPLGTIDEVLAGITPNGLKRNGNNHNQSFGVNKSKAGERGIHQSVYTSQDIDNKGKIIVYVYSFKQRQESEIKKYVKQIAQKLGVKPNDLNVVHRSRKDFKDIIKDNIILYEKGYKIGKELGTELNEAKMLLYFDKGGISEDRR